MRSCEDVCLPFEMGSLSYHADTVKAFSCMIYIYNFCKESFGH